MPKKVGSRLRSVTQKRNQGQFSVTLGYAKTLPRSVPGYARLHKNLNTADSWLLLVTQKRNQGQFPVTLCYRVSGYADP